ncbi:MAG: S53 family peptidase [Candidatus Eremiobacteraeota bacterium]|nr:S53 family peptidase [Candidatus Eremiobacteraeota bacterium]
MTRAFLSAAFFAASIFLSGCGSHTGSALPPAGPAPAPQFPQSAQTSIESCEAPPPGEEQCFARIRMSGAEDRLSQSIAKVWGYSPADLATAYSLPSSTAGGGHTVAIVDAYDNPNAEQALTAYRTQFNLKACTTANGCFRKLDQTGGRSYPAPNVSWSQEISLDLAMVSAICPNCKILLIEAKSSGIADMGAAENEAARLGATSISNSWGHTENAKDPTYEAQYFNHPGIAITASTGDRGSFVYFPAASRYVTAVGGTTLAPAANARGFTETTWPGTGGGCSINIVKPSWQHDPACPRRTVGDVAALADAQRGVAVYLSYGSPSGWQVMGGTSASAPIVAAAYALAPSVGTYASSIYTHQSALWDITAGSNGTCAVSYLCAAAPLYDSPSGWGSPRGLAAF